MSYPFGNSHNRTKPGLEDKASIPCRKSKSRQKNVPHCIVRKVEKRKYKGSRKSFEDLRFRRRHIFFKARHFPLGGVYATGTRVLASGQLLIRGGTKKQQWVVYDRR